MNRGFGGPLLCVGDLLRDVADEATVVECGDGEIDFTSSTLGGGLPPQLPLQPSCDLRQVFEVFSFHFVSCCECYGLTLLDLISVKIRSKLGA